VCKKNPNENEDPAPPAKHHRHCFLEIRQATDLFPKKKARIAISRSHSAEEFEF
jgi:hypothetical protein